MGQMFIHNMKMKTTVAKDDLLTALRTNRAHHSEIVKEAREGYMLKAQTAIENRLRDLKSGKLVHLSFSLTLPLDYTEAYDTAIKMVEMNKSDGIELDAIEFRCLVMDEWDWTNAFLLTNRQYSSRADEVITSRGNREAE